MYRNELILEEIGLIYLLLNYQINEIKGREDDTMMLCWFTLAELVRSPQL